MGILKQANRTRLVIMASALGAAVLAMTAVLVWANFASVTTASGTTALQGGQNGPIASYAAKFTCGDFAKGYPPAAPDIPEGPVVPGFYQTSINIHNPNFTGVSFSKKAVLLFAGKAPVHEKAFEQQRPPGSLHEAELGPDFGMLIDCQDIREVLLGMPASSLFIEGYVVIEVPSSSTSAGTLSPPPLDVTALYTANGWSCSIGTLCNPRTVERSGITEDLLTVQPDLVAAPTTATTTTTTTTTTITTLPGAGTG